MRRFILLKLIVVILMSPMACWAHNARIQGTVLNAGTSEPLPFAHIQLSPKGDEVLSDAFGNFSFTGLQEGNYTIMVSMLGFATKDVVVNADEMKPLVIRVKMEPAGLELKEVAITSSKVPGANKISEIDYRLRPVKTTQDLLRIVPGLFIAQHAGGGKAEQIFLRGFDIDHGTDISINVDGMPVNMVSHAHGQGYADLHWVIPETIESFGFGKGPYFASVGDFGTAGFVSFKTKDALEDNIVKLEAGNFNSYRGTALLKMPLKNSSKESGYVAGEYFYSDGPFEQAQHFKRANAFAKYNRWLNPKNRLQVSGSFFRSTWDASGQVPERAVNSGMISRFGSLDPTEGGNTGRVNGNVQLQTQLRNGTFWKNQAYVGLYDFSLYSNFTFFLEDSVNGDQIRQSENRLLAGYNSVLTWETHLGNYDLTMQAGGGVRYDQVRNNKLERTIKRQPLNEYLAAGDIDQLNSAAWLNSDLVLSPRFIVNAGARFDHIHYRYGDKLNNGMQSEASVQRIGPKLNLHYLASKNLRLFLNTGTGFHSNDARVAVPKGGSGVLPGAYGADLGGTIKIADKLILTAALWTLRLDQEFVYVGDAGIVEASGATIRRGLDISVRWQPLPWLYFDQDVNYSHARSAENNAEAGKYIPLAPAFTSIGGVSVSSLKRWSGSIRYRYIADRPANEDNSVVAKGYFINDLVASYTASRFTYSLTVENLFDIDWNEAQFDTESRLQNEPAPVSELHFTPGTPFAPRLGVSYKF